MAEQFASLLLRATIFSRSSFAKIVVLSRDWKNFHPKFFQSMALRKQFCHSSL